MFAFNEVNEVLIMLKLLAKSVLISLGLPPAATTTDAAIEKKMLGKILIKGLSKTIKYEVKEQKGGFLDMLLGTLGASLLG